jgi:hypothetical protein
MDPSFPGKGKTSAPYALTSRRCRNRRIERTLYAVSRRGVSWCMTTCVCMFGQRRLPAHGRKLGGWTDKQINAGYEKVYRRLLSHGSIVLVAGLEGVCDSNTTSERRESISRGNLSSIRLPESTPKTSRLPYALQSYKPSSFSGMPTSSSDVLDIQLASKRRS